jgi:hypothetical protein
MSVRMRLTFAVSLGVCLVAAVPATSATKRAVKPVPTVPYSALIVDAASGHPVVAAEVRNGTQVVLTDANGLFTLKLPAGRPTEIILHRTGYDDLTVSIGGVDIATPVFPVSSAEITMHPRPQILVQLTSGQTIHLDSDSVQFAYVLPFETPQGANNASFCKSDGTAWTPDRAEFAQITGPATSVTSSACCKLGPLLAVDVKMKNGDAAKVTFADSCYGYDIDFAGRDHDSAQYVYLNFKDIALITFP